MIALQARLAKGPHSPQCERLWISPRVSEPTASPFRVLSQISVTWWALGHLWFSKLNVLGLVSQVLVLKVGVTAVGFKQFPPQGEALGFEFPLDCMSLLGMGFMTRFCLSLSYLLWFDFPLIYHM